MKLRIELLIPAAAALLLLSGCGSSEKKAEESSAPKPAPEAAKPPAEAAKPPAEAGPKVFRVRFDTSKGPLLLEVHRDWAPNGVQRFEDLIKDGYYNGARFFRLVPNFVVQFGLAADPAMTKKWDKTIKDDPVVQTNRAYSLSFATAGPNTRTTQVFVNLRGNQILDQQGFAPFALITEGREVIDRLYGGYGERPDQDAITRQGNAYLLKSFPNLDYIKTVKIVE